MKTLEEKIIVFAKDWLNKSYSRCYNKESGAYEFEVYLDYQNNHIDQDTAKSLINELNKVTKENVKDIIYGHLDEGFIFSRDDEEEYILKQLWEDMINTKGLEDVEKHFDIWELREPLILDHNLIYVYVDFEEIISNSKVNVNIILEADESFNYEHSYNNFYEGLEEWNDNTKGMIGSSEIKYSDVSLYRLLESQGYSIEHLIEASENETDSKFIESLLEEVENTTSSCNSLVVTRAMPLNEYMELLDKKKSITITKDDTIGFIDFIFGGGSLVSISLEKDFEVKPNEYKIYIDGRYGYSVNSIYGQFFG